MSNKALSRLGLDEYVLKQLAIHGIHTVQDFFDWNEPQLMYAADLDLRGIRMLFAHVAEQSAPRLRSARFLYEQRLGRQCFLPTRIPSMDRALGGGLSRGSLSEVVGPAGVGKTQLCLTMAAVAGLSSELGGLGEGTGVLYLDTERKFSPTRLVEIAQRQVPDWFGGGSGLTQGSVYDGFTQGLTEETNSGATARSASSVSSTHSNVGHSDADVSGQRISQLLQRTHVLELDKSSDLMDKLENLEELLIEKRIGLIILDSIAVLARKDFNGDDDGRSGARKRKWRSTSDATMPPNEGPSIKKSHHEQRNGNAVGVSSSVSGNIARANALVSQAAALKRLADAFNLVVLITNQVTSSFGATSNASDIQTPLCPPPMQPKPVEGGLLPAPPRHLKPLGSEVEPAALPSLLTTAPAQLTLISGTSNALAMSDAPGFEMATGGGEHGFGGACVIPALGNSWHHCVSTRLVLEHFTTHRTVTVTKSPIAAQHTARCELTAAGLIETDADGKQLGFTVMP